MYEKEKRKGVPTRGLLYLAAGVVIGVLGMMLVTLIVNRVGRPEAEPTSLPVIPTPAMGVTGTALAQNVPMTIPGQRLRAFAVDEQKGLMAVSYENDNGESVLQKRRWDAENTLPAWSTLERGSTDYGSLYFDPELPNLIAFSGDSVRIFDLTGDQSRDEALRLIRYSPDGKWLASQADVSSEVIIVGREAGSPVNTLPTTSVPMAITFSPDSQMIALVGMIESHRYTIEVFRLSDLTLVKSYLFEAAYVSPVVFSPDNIHMAVGVDNSVRVLSLNNNEQRYFDTVNMIYRLTIDPTGRWLAIVGGETDPGGDLLITIYSLDKIEPLAPVLAMTQSIRMNDDIVGIQFVEEGLLVGEAWGNLTLYRWTGELWGNPVTIMENFE